MSERIKAFLIHLVISLVALAAILYVVVFIWYPPPFFAADGGWQGVRIIMGVDLVLGPLLTLAVYNPAKGLTKLKRDLITIGIIQVCSLAVGTWIVADQRTRMVSFANNRFVSMTETQIRESGISEQVYASLKTQHPPMAYVRLPDDPAEREQVVMGNLGGTPLFKRGDLYEPLTRENRMKIVDQGFNIDHVASVNPDLRPIVDEFLRQNDRSADQVVALPLYCRYAVLSLILDAESGEIIDTLDIGHESLIASRGYERLKNEGSLPQ